jgi:hypothetical protein
MIDSMELSVEGTNLTAGYGKQLVCITFLQKSPRMMYSMELNAEGNYLENRIWTGRHVHCVHQPVSHLLGM